MGPDGATERLLRRDRTIVIVAIMAMTAIASTYTVLGVGMDMPAYKMTRMPGVRDAGGMSGATMARAWSPAYAVLVFFMWWVMMVAMMLPSAAPAILLHSSLKRLSSPASTNAAAFLAGYLAVWALFSLVATGLHWGLESVGVLSASMMTMKGGPLAGGVLILAGLYQFTSLKHACLAHCQSPAEYLAANHRPGRNGAFRMGVGHGIYCLGCCWSLMALLFVGGVMNLWWIAGLAILVALEKLLPSGARIARISGGAMIVSGLVLAAGSFI